MNTLMDNLCPVFLSTTPPNTPLDGLDSPLSNKNIDFDSLFTALNNTMNTKKENSPIDLGIYETIE